MKSISQKEEEELKNQEDLIGKMIKKQLETLKKTILKKTMVKKTMEK